MAFSVPTLDRRSPGFTQAFGDALTSTGFAGVIGHGIHPHIIAGFHEVMRKISALPREVLEQYQHPGLGGQRGVCLTGERAKGETKFDQKQFWHVGTCREDFPDFTYPYGCQLLPNVWPAEVPEAREIMCALFEEQYQLGIWLLSQIEAYLAVPEGTLQEMVPGGDTILRGLYYPPVAPNALRASAHEDINLITLLVGAVLDDEVRSFQPRFTGLEVRDIGGTWHQVLETPGCIMVNVGDMLQEWTRGIPHIQSMPSTTHRVVAAPGICEKPRTAAPLFMHPNPGTALSYRNDGAPFTAHQYLLERLGELGLLTGTPPSFEAQAAIIKKMNARRR